jgi:hypothetical protein
LRKIGGVLFALVLAVSLVLVPATVFAGIGDNCSWDTVKWENNENSWFLYLQNWGRTPMTAMSRLAGLAYPDALNSDVCNASGSCNGKKITGCDIPLCFGSCTCCNQESGASACCVPEAECTVTACSAEDAQCLAEPKLEEANCCCCWGVSLAFANKSWSGCDISTHPRVNNNHPNHFGVSNCGAENYGGDWGLSGCPHTECCSLTWCLQDNLCANPGVNKL